VKLPHCLGREARQVSTDIISFLQQSLQLVSSTKIFCKAPFSAISPLFEQNPGRWSRDVIRCESFRQRLSHSSLPIENLALYIFTSTLRGTLSTGLTGLQDQ
jgi:hypothetical protein